MFKLKKYIFTITLLVGIVVACPTLAAQTRKIDKTVSGKVLGVSTVRGGTTTVKKYQFLFADKKDDVHHGEWLPYQVAILNLSNDELDVPWVEVAVNARYKLKNITTPNSVIRESSSAAESLKTTTITWQDIKIPKGQKAVRTFLARVPDKGDPTCLKATAWIKTDDTIATRSECNSVVPLNQKAGISPLDFTRVRPYFKSAFKKDATVLEEAFWNKRLTWLGDLERMKQEMLVRVKKGISPTL
jgi:hypothetical protein